MIMIIIQLSHAASILSITFIKNLLIYKDKKTNQPPIALVKRPNTTSNTEKLAVSVNIM